MALSEAERVVREQLVAAIAQLAQPYCRGLAPLENDPALADSQALRANRAWAGYVTAFQVWTAANPARSDLATVFSADSLFLNLLIQSPDFGLVLNDERIDPATGYISFSILPPFRPEKTNIQLPGVIEALRTRRIAMLRKKLSGLRGKLWSSHAIRKALESFYANLGLAPQIVIAPRSETIEIIEGQRIGSIMLPDTQVPARDLDRILWSMFTTRDFHRAMLSKGQWAPNRVVNLHQHLGYLDGDQPYLIQQQLDEWQVTLSQLGYALAVLPSKQAGISPYVDLCVQKGSPAAGSKSRRVAIGFEYKPGQGVQGLGLLQASRLPLPVKDSAATVQAGGPSGDRIAGTYSVHFIGFGRLHQEVGIAANTSSEVQTHRFLDGIKLDEHRLGGDARFEWRPFRDFGGTALAFYLDANHQRVSLERNTGTVLKQDLNDLELGASFLSNSAGSLGRRRTSIEPSLVIGIGPAFQRFRITANTHRKIGLLEYDFTGHFDQATRTTPIFELPSLGGGDTVRGFRADDAVGQRLWSVQSELWLPIPALNEPQHQNPQLQAIVRGLRLAPFFDLGAAYQTRASRPGERHGVGLGLRLDLQVAVLKLDWAYGFGDAATSGSRAKFYFSADFNIQH